MDVAATVGVGFGAAVLGALVGGIAASALEVWRRGLDGVSAARLIRMELIQNRVLVGLALKGRKGDLNLRDDAWQAHRLSLAPLLDEIQLGRLWRDVGFLGQAQLFLQDVTKGTDEKRAVGTRELGKWRETLHRHGRELRTMETSRKLGHMRRLLTGWRLPSEEELETAFSRPAERGEN